MIETGISFDAVHSYNDLNLILSDSDIPPANPKTTYVDIPGGDGSLDLTEAHGEVKYNDRDCKFTFTVSPAASVTWEEKKTEVSNTLNGKNCKITLDKDGGYYYLGRCTVDDYLSDKKINQIVVSAKVKPYKFKQTETSVSFSLSQTQKTVTVTNGRKVVSPTIVCTNDNTTVIFGSITKTLSAGTHKVLDIRFTEGTNTLTVSGSGTITFKFQEGDL